MKRLRTGQTVVLLMVFTAVTLVIVSAAVAVMITTSQSSTKFELGQKAYSVAEAGAENGVLRLLRDHDYTGETLNIGSGSAVITVSGTTPYTLTSKGTVSTFLRTIQVTATENNGILTVGSWQEIF